MNIFLLGGCVAIDTEFSRDAQIDSGPELSDGQIREMLELRVDISNSEARSKMGNPSTYKVFGNVYNVFSDNKGYSEIGLASWYGKKFHGRKTSNGETFNMYALSAAHRSLVLPAFVRVQNMENGKSTVVRVNDRGPFHKDRLIDLSVAAAIQLGFYEKGLARVKIEIVDSQVEKKIYALEVGEFNEQRTAREFMENMRGLISSGPVLLSIDVLVNSKYFVRIGPVQEGDEVDRLEALVKLMDVPNYRLVPIDFRNELNKAE